jgi:curli biogenesis system outer membrane secretion channel CsgG
MRSLIRVLAAVAGAALVAAAPVSAQSSRSSIALLDFDFSSIEHWWSGNQDVGKGVADMMVDALVDSGEFRVFDRAKIETVLREQNFNNSDRVDPSQKAAWIGKVAGVTFLIAGSITKFGTEENSRSVGAGAFGGGKFGLGNVGTRSGKAVVAINLRVIDTSTTEITATAKGEGTSKRSGLLLGGAGGGSAGGGAELNMGSSNFHDTILGEATEAAVTATIAQLLQKKDRLK